MAFARHAGVLEALEDADCDYYRVVGTSSGSLAGAMAAAGLPAALIAEELSRQQPIALMTPSWRVNRGLFSLRGLEMHLRTILPKDFDQLERPFACGVMVSSYSHPASNCLTDFHIYFASRIPLIANFR